MSLSASEQQALDSIEATLTSSDPKPRSTDAFSGISVFTQVSALIGAVDDCT